jgi:hypothetical protein
MPSMLPLDCTCTICLWISDGSAKEFEIFILVGGRIALYTKKRTGIPEAMYVRLEPGYQLVSKETDGDFLN